MESTRTQVERQSEQLDRLMCEVRRQLARGTAPDVRRILDWLRRQTHAHVALVAHDVHVVEAATPDFPRAVLRPLAELLARLSDGRLATAVTHTGGLHVRCEALGFQRPHPVLVAAGRQEPSPETVALLAHTGSVLTLLRQAGESDRIRRNYQAKARQLRFAVLQALLTGQPTLARRMTVGAVPPLLEAGRLRLYLLHCPPGERDRIALAHQDPSGYHGADLLVHCPVFHEHLICLLAEESEETEIAVEAQGGLAATLRRLVHSDPRFALGISGAHPLESTAGAYGQATHALAAARPTPERMAFYHGRTPLEGILLPRESALVWAHGLLHPLRSIPATSAEVTRLAVNLSRSAVARLLGLSRNTVSAHLRKAEQALDEDLLDVQVRADVHLALALTGCGAAPVPQTGDLPPHLDDLLGNERAAAWARTVLRPLDDRHRRTLQAWIEANTDAQRAARRAGVSRNTVRAHLRAAEGVLGLDLLTGGTGVHDVVHALRIADMHGI
ncbi:helix-turn-helix domain-containing protein [Streptomyces venezuelae]|nr:helix-turn-helix domain-containing protein [Streptomyces venezuelae]